MSHTRTWSTSTPVNTEPEGDGYKYIVNKSIDVAERLACDHNMDGIIDTSLPTADGYHKKVTLKEQGSDPSILTGGAVLYAKSDGLYFRNSAGIVKII